MKKFMYAFIAFFALTTFFSCEIICGEWERDPNCVCTFDYDPVCGCNNRTYRNPCEAECYGITSYTWGECR
jgi:Kazal-type serine protease inhibitor domain